MFVKVPDIDVTPVPVPKTVKFPETLLLVNEVIVTEPELGFVKFSVAEKL